MSVLTEPMTVKQMISQIRQKIISAYKKLDMKLEQRVWLKNDKEIRDLDLRLETLKQDEMRDKRRKEETETLFKTIDNASQRRDVRGGSNQPEQVYDMVRPRRSEYDKTYEYSLHHWSSRILSNTERETDLESQITNQRNKSLVSARRQLKFEDSENVRSIAVQTPSEERSYNSFNESQ